MHKLAHQAVTGAPESIEARLKHWRWRVFAATWLSYACYYFCRKPFFIAKPVLEKELGWDASTLATLGASFLIAYAVGQFVAAWAGDRFGPRLLVLTGMAVSAACNIAFGFTNSFGMFAGFMIINGLAQATGWCGNVASMAYWFRRKERGSVMGIWATNFQVGGVAANGLAAFTLGAAGFRWSFFAGSVVLIGAWAFFVFNQKNRPSDVGLPPIEDDNSGQSAQTTANQHEENSWSRQVWTNVLLVGCFYFFVKFIRYALWSWAPYLLYKYFHLKASDAGYLSTVFDVAGIAGVICVGFLSDRFFGGRRVKLCFYFILLMAASCVLLYFIGRTNLWFFGLSIGLIGFALYGPDAIMTSAGAIEVGSREAAAKAAGIINGMGAVGSVVQEFAIGRALDGGGVVAVFAALVASSVFAAAFLWLLVLRNRSGKADL